MTKKKRQGSKKRCIAVAKAGVWSRVCVQREACRGARGEKKKQSSPKSLNYMQSLWKCAQDTPSPSIQVQACRAAFSTPLCGYRREGDPLKVGRKKHLILDYLINRCLPCQKLRPPTSRLPHPESPDCLLKEQVCVTHFLSYFTDQTVEESRKARNPLRHQKEEGRTSSGRTGKEMERGGTERKGTTQVNNEAGGAIQERSKVLRNHGQWGEGKRFRLRLTPNLLICTLWSAITFHQVYLINSVGFCIIHGTVADHSVKYASCQMYFLDSSESTVLTYFETSWKVKLLMHG